MQDINTDIVKISDSALNTPHNIREFENQISEVTEFLLFDTNWNTSQIKGVDALSDTVMICRGDNCPYASKCPVLKAMNQQQKEELEGTDCRVERLLGLKMFTDFLRNLGVQAHETADVLNVATIIRLTIQIHRIDWDLAVKGMMVYEPATVIQASKKVVYKQVQHPLLVVQQKLQDQINRLQTKLIASRQDRANLMKNMGGDDLLSQLFQKKTKTEENNTIIESKDLAFEDTDV